MGLGNDELDARKWWVLTQGHYHPHIMSTIQEQASKLNQIILAAYTHEPAEELAAQLLQLTPLGLEHILFSDSGSTSVKVGLKMTLGYWNNIGQRADAHCGDAALL